MRRGATDSVAGKVIGLAGTRTLRSAISRTRCAVFVSADGMRSAANNTVRITCPTIQTGLASAMGRKLSRQLLVESRHSVTTANVPNDACGKHDEREDPSDQEARHEPFRVGVAVEPCPKAAKHPKRHGHE